MPKTTTTDESSGGAPPTPPTPALEKAEVPPNPTLKQHAKKLGVRAGALGALCFSLKLEPSSRDLSEKEFLEKLHPVARSREAKVVARKAADERAAEHRERNRTRPIRKDN